jgi:hypothetical protein
MKKIQVAFIGIALLLLGLAACMQASPPPVQVGTAAPVLASATSLPSPSPLPPTAAPTATLTPTATLVPTALPIRTYTFTALPPTATVPSATPTVVNLTPFPHTVSGVVKDEKGPVANAIVQLHGRPEQVRTDAKGAFQMNGLSGTTPITITAWADGYYVGYTVMNPSAPDWKGFNAVPITLKPVPQTDNTQYPWFSFNGVKGSASCGLCHRDYKEWLADAHSQAAVNPRFLSIYTGTDVKGNPGQLVKLNDKGKAEPPDPSKPYYGPGFRLDYPNRAGNCATCHTPVASKVPNTQNCGWSGCHTDLTHERAVGVIAPATLPIGTTGDGKEGITCDFCHKIAEAIIDPQTKLPKPDMPGILSYRLTRPEDGQQVFYGTLVDVPRRDTYLPLLERSEYCAPCHYGVFGGVVGDGMVTGGVTVYNSYGEWLKSPYSDPKTGKTCQQCHMPVVPEKYYVFPEAGGLTRDYVQLHNHTMPGAYDEKFLQNSVTLKAQAARSGASLQVDVRITNDQVGHDIPTDMPSRQMILVVEARDAGGKLLNLVKGPLNPGHAGNYGGLPGKTFMKVLRDDWTQEAPTAAYWRPVTLLEDTRLPALATDATQYTFDLPAGQTAEVKVKLVFRRNYQKLMQEKGWTDADILMEEATIQVAK